MAVALQTTMSIGREEEEEVDRGEGRCRGIIIKVVSAATEGFDQSARTRAQQSKIIALTGQQ